MGWEYRNGKRYYYEKTRQGDKVVLRYIGAGRLASLAAALAQLQKERIAQERLEARQERAEWAALSATPPELQTLLESASRVTVEALQAAGYHQHKRQWRKKRGSKTTTRPKTKLLDPPVPAPLLGLIPYAEWFRQTIRAVEQAGATEAQRAEFRKLLEAHPDLAERYGLEQMYGNVAREPFKSSPIAQESQTYLATAMRAALLGAAPSPLEALLVDVVCAAHEDYWCFVVVYKQKIATFNIRTIAELARVRRLLNLPAPQVNINLPGGRQLNVAGKVE